MSYIRLTNFVQKKQNMIRIKTKSLLTILFLSQLLGIKINAQSVSYSITDQTNTVRKLSIRPNIALGIDYFNPSNLYVGTNVDARYWHNKLFDARGGITVGTFTGATFGGTYHLKDREIEKSHKFVTSQTQSGNKVTTRYFKGNANVRSVFGPCLDVRIGKYGKENEKGNGFFEVNLGVETQRFSRVYADVGSDSYPSNKNGWYSLKFVGIYAHRPERNGIGFAGSMEAARRPWKGVTIFLNMQMGVFKTFGGELAPIITPGFGISINLLNPKN